MGKMKNQTYTLFEDYFNLSCFKINTKYITISLLGKSKFLQRRLWLLPETQSTSKTFRCPNILFYGI